MILLFLCCYVRQKTSYSHQNLITPYGFQPERKLYKEPWLTFIADCYHIEYKLDRTPPPNNGPLFMIFLACVIGVIQ